jgi:hypothetical protein
MSGKVKYKQFTEEEDRIYRQNIESIRSNLRNGVKFDLACEFVTTDDRELKTMIVDDALKIEIAEFHYGKNLTLAEVSRILGVPMERLLKANSEMIEDIVNTANEHTGRESGGKGPTVH